jgi:beta-phosphoglucomutase-like phosphatase (HAD superfamily)/molybdopterin-guanine dinucleotide biosynthesis protein A
MNIIIPVGGKGERFLNYGYKKPKPLINVLGKPMIFYVLDNLKLTNEDKVFIIYYNIEDNIFRNVISEKYPYINFIRIKFQTKGAAETIYEGLKQIINLTTQKKCMIFDCDTFYTEDVVSMYRNVNTNAVFYVINKEDTPIYSYINMDADNIVDNIVEKVKISDNANTGIYCFYDIDALFKYSQHVVENNIMFKNECYTSCIIDQMIQEENIFIGIKLDNNFVYNLGTPEQVITYIDNTHIFLFDLDGTIVLTEHIYYDIWKEILYEYGIILTEDIFMKIISGNSDKNVIEKIHLNKNISLEKLSLKKDKLFINNLQKIKLINGIENTLQIIKKHGHKLAIVTNCNREVAETILSYTKLSQYVEFIIVGNECNNPKPFPDPYTNAIVRFNGTNKKTIIFEDSKTGLLSANAVSPKCIIGIETTYTKKELFNSFADVSLKDYSNFDISLFTNFNKDNNLLKNRIISSLDFDIKDIEINNIKLKGGFISDVIDVKIVTDKEMINCVIKLENSNENFLTEMSQNLDLYNREYYFYKNMSNKVPINVPKFYGLIKNTDEKNIGVLLENLNNKDYKLNLNLNNENIKVSFNIIDSLAKLHSKFWGKNINEFNDIKKNNDSLFNPYWNNFIKSRWNLFLNKWEYLLNDEQINTGKYIVSNFLNIQQKLSDKNLTFCHGDVKSANIFYRIVDKDNYEPYFIDWQYIIHGKGVQDLVFFMIESFDISKMKIYKNLFKEYYYVKLIENGVNYSKQDYETDFKNASFYFPFFVAIWFGTINEDELIDKDFPCEFIKKLFNFYII